MYIHERDNWTSFRWDTSQVSLLQEKVFRKQGLLYGRMSSLGFDSKLRAMTENLTYDVVYSSEIEGIRLNVDQDSIVYDAEDLSQFFTEVSISEENGIPYLKAIFKGKKPVSERLLKLDAERFKKEDLPLSNLLSKYCSYIAQSSPK